jgi:DNA-binding IclR family transcriptional regulator
MTKESGILGRYAALLEALAVSSGGLSLTEIAEATDLPPGSVHRLIKALAGVGFIAPRDGRKVYVLGPRLFRLLHMSVAPAMISPLVRPVLDSLARRFCETSFVAKLVGGEVRSIEMVHPSSESQSYVQPGRVMPIHAAASAKAIWAFQDDAALDAALVRPHTKFTEKTRVTVAEIRADLDRVRHQGFAFCDEELDPGVLSYACPIHLDGVGVIYSIGMVGLTPRLEQHSRRDIVSALRGAADDVENGLPGRLGRSVARDHPTNDVEWAGR